VSLAISTIAAATIINRISMFIIFTISKKYAVRLLVGEKYLRCHIKAT
jgi:hypothetical protein